MVPAGAAAGAVDEIGQVLGHPRLHLVGLGLRQLQHAGRDDAQDQLDGEVDDADELDRLEGEILNVPP